MHNVVLKDNIISRGRCQSLCMAMEAECTGYESDSSDDSGIHTPALPWTSTPQTASLDTSHYKTRISELEMELERLKRKMAGMVITDTGGDVWAV